MTMTEITVLDELRLVEQAGLMRIKGNSYTDVAEVLEVSVQVAKNYINQYHQVVEQMAESDPFFLERVQFNTLKALDEFNEISKEAWETVGLATEAGMITARTQALKLALDTANKKAQLHQLMSGGTSDGEFIARMQKAETVNQVVSKVIRDVVSDCERCRPLAHNMLREAYALMESEGFESPEDIAESLEFEDDAEVVDG